MEKKNEKIRYIKNILYNKKKKFQSGALGRRSKLLSFSRALTDTVNTTITSIPLSNVFSFYNIYLYPFHTNVYSTDDKHINDLFDAFSILYNFSNASFSPTTTFNY